MSGYLRLTLNCLPKGDFKRGFQQHPCSCCVFGCCSQPGCLHWGLCAESSLCSVPTSCAEAMKNVLQMTVIWGSSRKSFSAGGWYQTISFHPLPPFPKTKEEMKGFIRNYSLSPAACLRSGCLRSSPSSGRVRGHLPGEDLLLTELHSVIILLDNECSGLIGTGFRKSTVICMWP